MVIHFLSEPVEALRAHCGVAVTPAGTSVGQLALWQSGAQNFPVMPVIETGTSSDSHPSVGLP